MEFVLNGVGYSLEASTVHSVLRGGAPDPVREHWVDVDGVRWPPKQALALVTGLHRAAFTSHRALGLFERLGFRTSPWGTGRTATPRVPDRPRDEPAASRAAAAPGDDTGVVLVGCSGAKAAWPTRAAELFTGAAFRKGRGLAIRSGKPRYVLSAKYGLLDPEDVIGPYDVYLPDTSKQYRTTWGEWVVAQLVERMDLASVRVEVHAGDAYTAPLREPLSRLGAELHEPLAGLRQGERLAWYGSGAESADDEVPDVAPLLDERTAVPPAEFLADGRTAAARPGLYSWWVDQVGAHDLSAGLGHRVASGLVYAGRAGGVRPNGKASANTLWGRVGDMHLGGSRQFSTFRLTLAAALSSPGGPVADEASVTAWMHRHLRVAILPLPPGSVSSGEEELLRLADPPLNLRDVPATELRRTLSRRRSALTAASKGTA